MNKPMSPAARALAAARNNRDLQMAGKETIKFEHRRPDMTKDYVRKDFAEFDLFNTLCVARGVNQLIDNVFYDTNSKCFHIGFNKEFELHDGVPIVRECGESSLSQFEIGGTVFHKGGSHGES